MSEVKNIPEGWMETTLEKAIDIKHGYAFKGEFISLEVNNKILITPGNFKVGGGFKSDKFKYYAGDFPEDYILKPNDVIVTMTDLSKEGDTLGFSAKIPEDNSDYLHNQRIGLVKFINSDFDKEFIYWFLRTNHYQKSMVNSSTGSTVRHTSPNRIKEYNFYCPTIQEQKSIASILTAFDDKIELLQAQNKTLEATAQTIFAEWFGKYGVDDVLPEGWRVGKLGDLINIIGGGTPKTSVEEYWNGNILWYSIVDSPNGSNCFVIETEKKISEDGLKNSSTKILRQGTTIISARGTVGKLAIVGEQMAMNQSCYGIQGKDNVGDFFTYFQIKNSLIQLQNNVHGAVFDTITKPTLEEIDSIIPSEDLLVNIEELLASVMNKVLINVYQIQTLTKTRDELLPRLMSGEVRVNEFKNKN